MTLPHHNPSHRVPQLDRASAQHHLTLDGSDASHLKRVPLKIDDETHDKLRAHRAIRPTCGTKRRPSRAVIVYTTASGQIGYASFGQTKLMCDVTKVLADKLYDRAMKFFEEGQ